MTSPAPDADRSLRFLLEEADIRGQTVSLDDSLRDILAPHAYPRPVRTLLGEFTAAAVLLATTLKFDGRLVLQARSQGQIPLMMVECGNDLTVRGIARGADAASAVEFRDLLGDGQLAITIEPARGQRYQGLVPLDGGSLAASLDHYFRQSEQLRTRLWLACDGTRAGGMLIQQLPAQRVKDPSERERQWEHAETLAQTLTPQELLQVDDIQLVHRLFHQDPLRVFEPRPVRFHCSCSRERTLNALGAIGPAEIESILQEQGSVTMDCEFCNQRYVFRRDDLEAQLDPARGQTLH